MGKILTERQLQNRLEKYYKEHYGELDTDEWFVNPANNVWLFVRDGKIITLKCHILTGEITENSKLYIKENHRPF